VKVVPQMNEMQAPTKIPKVIKMTKDLPPPPQNVSQAGFGDAGAPGIFGSSGSGPAIVVKEAAPKKIAVSSGVMEGNILSRPSPQYPAIAKAARIQGTVVLSATISKGGTIENLKLISGPEMLAGAAEQAVREWRYKPYELNGEPVEVQTTINVTFTLGGD
jgi:protein TonB